ncbi:IclR family transcriptional regulator [Ilumatobacter sp.]|uniref:IclR family transcriptional regulator n=1 Tax=Ilumatobacter sp. TaxID=1967498 RepID=UPI003B5266E7
MDIVTGVGVLDKAVRVLRAVGDEPQHLSRLQTTTGLPRATAHRLATALERHRLLRRGDDGAYELGPGLVELGRLARDRSPLVERARPILAELRDATGESVQLFVRDGDGRRCVVSMETPHGLRWIVPEGALLPLDAGSAGHVLSASVAAGDPTPGWVHSVGEREPGVASVSAPVVVGSGEVVAAVSVSGPIERLTRRPGAVHGAAVVVAAERVAAAVDGGGPSTG